MKVRKFLFGAVAILSYSTAAFAGPCTAAIDRTRAQVDAMLAARAAAGPTAAESQGAMLRHQPTPGSIAAAESKLGDISLQMVETIETNMMRAREADRAGDATACEQALAEVQHALASSRSD
jgi:hypothetical protein